MHKSMKSNLYMKPTCSNTALELNSGKKTNKQQKKPQFVYFDPVIPSTDDPF